MNQQAPQIELRAAAAADLEWLLDLRLTTMTEHLERAGEYLSLQDQRERVLHDFAATRIIQRNGRDIGMMKVVREGDVWHLVQIQIQPRHQGQGLGSALICALLDDARRAHVAVSLHVLKVNPAKALYDRLGFEVIGDTGESYEMRALVR